MKKQLTLSEKLKRYSLLTGGAMATALAGDAQIVYTDVVPDFVGSGDMDYQIDLNNDGVVDFFLSRSEDAGAYWEGFCSGGGDIISSFSHKKLTGYGNCLSCVLAESAYDLSVYDLNEYDDISDVQTWFIGGVMAAYSKELEIWSECATWSGDIGTWTNGSPSSYGYWLGVVDKYVGVRIFKDDHFYYGWVRLTVDSFSYTLKDYAYETIPDSAITAGNMGCGVFYMDTDGDGYGSMLDPDDTACIFVSDGLVSNNLDCDDSNGTINPIAIESCNNLDDDCNGAIDDGVQNIYYADSDGDGYGDPNNSTLACTLPNGFVIDNTDCNDNNSAINPSESEICNNTDDNCNGSIDDGLVFTTYYADNDGDNYGDPDNSEDACEPISNFVLDNTDCDDSNPNVNPAATEITNNNIDDDCDGDVDEFGVGVSSINTNTNQLSVFPNPTDGKFVIELELRDAITGEATIEVINLLGQIMQSQKVAMVKGKLQQKIQFSKEEAEGMYLVKVTIGDKIFTAQIDLQK